MSSAEEMPVGSDLLPCKNVQDNAQQYLNKRNDPIRYCKIFVFIRNDYYYTGRKKLEKSLFKSLFYLISPFLAFLTLSIQSHKIYTEASEQIE